MSLHKSKRGIETENNFHYLFLRGLDFSVLAADF